MAAAAPFAARGAGGRDAVLSSTVIAMTLVARGQQLCVKYTHLHDQNDLADPWLLPCSLA